jgi:D-threo-aldose 1-dehydrogenase
MTRNQSNDGMMRAFSLRHVGRTALKVGVLGLGGAPLGDLYERIPESQARATLESAYSRGIRLFDTAPLYGHGLSEHRFGHVLRGKPRNEFVLSTKSAAGSDRNGPNGSSMVRLPAG